MTQKVFCSKCGHLLYESDSGGGELKTLEDIIKTHEGHCPKCNKELKYDKEHIAENVIVKPAEISRGYKETKDVEIEEAYNALGIRRHTETLSDEEIYEEIYNMRIKQLQYLHEDIEE